MKKLQVIGLQRSGTNFLENIIRNNFDILVVRGSRDFSFKHGFPNEKYISENGKFNTINIENIEKGNPFIVLINKIYPVWLDSIKKFPADLYIQRPSLKNTDLESFHSDFYEQWEHNLKEKGINFISIDYIDLLKDFEGTLDKIMNQFQLKKKGQYTNVQKVNHSNTFKELQRQNYINKYNKYENSMKLYNNHITFSS